MSLFRKFAKNNKGLSLVELIVTVAILAIVTAGLGTAMVSATRNYNRSSAEIDVQSEVQNVTNILTNLVVDSAKVISDPSGAVGKSNELYIKSIDGCFYYIGLNNTTLFYNKINSTEAAANDDATNYANAKAFSNILASNVVGFSADTTSFPNNYTVHFSVNVVLPNSGRDMVSSFSATSRNAAGAGVQIEVAKSAIILADSMVVIEPCQGADNGTAPIANLPCQSSNVYALDYSILVTGGASPTLAKAEVFSRMDTSSTVVTTLGVTYDANKIYFNADKELAGSTDGCVYVKLTTPDGFYKWITVYVRRVTDVTCNGNYTGSNPVNKFKSGATYKVASTVYASNPSRFFAFATDNHYSGSHSVEQCFYEYVNPYSVVWTVSADKFTINPYTLRIYKVGGDGTNLTGAFLAGGYIGSAEDTFNVELGADLAGMASITFKATALHPEGVDATGKKTNKTGKKYIAADKHISGTYTISNFSLFVEETNYQRGNAINQPLGLNDVNAAIEYIYGDLYKKYKGAIDSYPDGSTEKIAMKKYIDFVDSLKTKNLSLDSFFRIDEYDILTTKVTGTDGDVYLSDEVHIGWSQYRKMTSGNYYRFSENEATRLVADTYQTVEFIAVLRDPNTNLIYWPYYTDLVQNGFGPKEISYGVNNNGSFTDAISGNYKPFFAEYAELVTGSFESYAYRFTINPYRYIYEANAAAGIEYGAQVVGSYSAPVYLNKMSGGSVTISYDQENWPNIGKNWFQNNLGALLQYRGDDGKWVNMKTITGNTTEFRDGAFKVVITNCSFTISKMDNLAPKDDRVFRIIPMLYKPKGYINLADTALAQESAKLTSEKYIYYLNKTENMYADNTVGAIYFKAFDDSAKQTIIIDANGGSFGTDADGKDITQMSYSYYPMQNVCFRDLGICKDDKYKPVNANGNMVNSWWSSADNSGKRMNDYDTNSSDARAVTILYAHYN